VPSFSEEKEAKRLYVFACTSIADVAGEAGAGAKNKGLLVLFFRKELLSSHQT
jgi:hypothetical protein